ncbi:hypothetical protein ACFFWD_28465 [Bradyrhizobium erythrophlei]|uniref:hypothetical protein n=1 Tax=Bradyrhizobium erythrophlei TaxID=1437360 RepID=UPI0035E89044
MGIAGSRISSFALMLTVGLAAALLPTRSQAYTADEQQACTGDAFRLCSADIPDVDRVTACMVRKQAQLSPPCRAFFRSEPGEVSARPAKRPVATRRAAKSRKAKKPAAS